MCNRFQVTKGKCTFALTLTQGASYESRKYDIAVPFVMALEVYERRVDKGMKEEKHRYILKKEYII